MAFYPTYEEWKPVAAGENGSVLKTLFILPMRNGNVVNLSSVNALLNPLFILPMRNGNSMKAKGLLTFLLTFLSYL